MTNLSNNRLMNWLTPIIVCAAASAFYIYDFIIRVMPSAMTRDLMLAFDLQASGLGILASLYFFGYAPMQIPSGMLYDRFGPRILLSLSLLICSITVFSFGATHNYYIALFSRFMMGATASFSFVGALVVGANWFSPRFFAIYVGIVQLLGCIGAIVGQGPIASLTLNLGWHKTVMLIAMVGMLLAIINWLLIRDYPKNKIKTSLIAKNHNINFRKIFTISQNWWASIYAFFIWAPIVSFAILWGVPFLQDVYHFSRVEAASLTSIIWIGVAVGGPLLGWWSNFIVKRKLPLVVAAFIGLIASLGLFYMGNLSNSLLLLFLFLLGLGAAAQATIFAFIHDINHKETLGTAVGFTNMAVISGGAIVQPLIGILLQLTWDGKIEKTIPIYTMHNFQIALSLIPLCFLIAFLVSLFFLKETYCKHENSKEMNAE